MTTSVINPLNSVPLVNSTQILSASAQVPTVSQVPITTSTPVQPVVSQAPILQSVQPVQSAIPTISQDQHYTTQTTLNTLVDEDYRLGRGILDDFRPNAYRSQVGVVGNTTTNVITSTVLPVTPAQVVTTTPVLSTTTGVGGANTLKEFL